MISPLTFFLWLTDFFERFFSKWLGWFMGGLFMVVFWHGIQPFVLFIFSMHSLCVMQNWFRKKLSLPFFKTNFFCFNNNWRWTPPPQYKRKKMVAAKVIADKCENAALTYYVIFTICQSPFKGRRPASPPDIDHFFPSAKINKAVKILCIFFPHFSSSIHSQPFPFQLEKKK